MKHHLRGWKRDHEDERDYRLSRVGAYFRSITIPPSVNLAQGRLPRVEDQGQLGSCVANASTSALEYLDIKSKNPVTELSQLFAYYACRVWVEKQQANADEGCEIRDMMKALAKYGVCAESIWPYVIGAFNVAPPQVAIDEAKHRTILAYYRCPTLNTMRVSLAQGYPVVGGFNCYESIDDDEVARTGRIPLPKPNEPLVGGHCILYTGYLDRDADLIFENSWGLGWGQRGFGSLPYEYIKRKLAGDNWTIRSELRK